MSSKPFISIVLPVHNQADHISTVVTEYEQALTQIPYSHECILVVNGCQDGSLEVCSKLSKQFGVVRVLHNEKKGWGLAVKLGLNEARGDILCFTNAARTSARDLVLLLLYAVSNPGVIIKANRRIRESLHRRLGSLLYNLECRYLFDLSCWDVNGTPKVFPRSCSRLLQLTQDADLFDVEFDVICQRENYPLLEVPVFSVRRHSGRSTTGLRSAWYMYLGVLRLWRNLKRNNS